MILQLVLSSVAAVLYLLLTNAKIPFGSTKISHFFSKTNSYQEHHLTKWIVVLVLNMLMSCQRVFMCQPDVLTNVVSVST